MLEVTELCQSKEEQKMYGLKATNKSETGIALC